MACVVVALTMVSCARLGLDRWNWGFGGEEDSAAVAAQAEPQSAAPAVSDADREALLRQAVAEYMASASGDQACLVRRRPYFLKEYSVYSGGAETARLSITQTDSRLKPYVATVEIDKQRFATRLHRDRDEAAADESFLRDTGTEKLSYEWNGGRWVKSGSLFVASATEEQVNGQWQPVPPAEKRTVAAEEEESQGFLKRAMSLITGN
jgi:hypothetical protein